MKITLSQLRQIIRLLYTKVKKETLKEGLRDIGMNIRYPNVIGREKKPLKELTRGDNEYIANLLKRFIIQNENTLQYSKIKFQGETYSTH